MNSRGSDRLVAIDSDGSVFPNMPAKFDVMRDTTIAHFGLQPVGRIAEEVIRFINLEGRSRGSHRLTGLVQIVGFLEERLGPGPLPVDLPRLDSLRRFMTSCGAWTNESLAAAVAETGDPELARILEWSRDFSDRLACTGRMPPVPEAVRAMTALRERARLVVVSQAPEDQLLAEWAGAGIAGLVARIGGSDKGPKPVQIRAALDEAGIPPARAAIIGDAPGDLSAARETGIAFLPIVPGREGASWDRLLDEAWPRFLAGSFEGAYARGLADEFLAALPERPPWAPLRD
jgi:phosphoglycolate phosphatase-like HAD superfamily hydrolase